MAARELIALEDVAKMPAPGLSAPANVSFSPDGRIVAFLHAPGAQSGLSRQLYALDVTSRRVSLLAAPPNQGNTEGNLSLEEKLRRERQRQMGVGITSYAWNPSPHSQRLLYPLQGDLYIQEQPGAELKLLFDKTSTGAAGGAIDPQFSPDGRWVAFVQDKEVYVISSTVTEGGQEAVQVTQGARGVDGKSNGLACFLTQEELSRFRGFWWSPDSSRLAFEEIDESHIPKFRIMHSGSPEPTGDAAQEDHRYPFAGAANPKRRLGVIKLPHAEQEHAGLHFLDHHRQIPTPVWMDFAAVNPDPDFYVSRVNWLPDQSLGVQRLNRLQTEVMFLRFDVQTGRATTLIHETNSVWLNSNYLFRNIEAESKNTFRFLWGSERCGYMHLYLYEYTAGAPGARLLGAVTSGKWNVESVEGIDLAQGRVYFCGTADSPLERHLYVTSLFPNSDPILPPTRLTGAEGMHSVVMDGSCRTFVDVYSNTTTPTRAPVCAVPSDAEIAAVKPVEFADPSSAAVPAPVPADLAALFQGIPDLAYPLTTEQEDLRVSILQAQGKLCEPKIISFPTRDGKETLYGAVYLPDPKIHGDGPYPTMVSVYGGPHVQRVGRMWAMTVDMRAQRFRDMGYAVLKVDNRGSFRRGSAFEGAIKHCMGTVEILDQQDGVQKLVNEGITIEGRVGIYGWSYGGYMAAISLMKAPETFKLAIAGAPVTSWDGYDTCYTERYMSTPQLNPGGYFEGSVMEAVGNMQSGQKLMLIHGLIDENVHFRHTARLISALINARKHYDLLLFPGERHSPRHLEDRIYMEQRIAEYVQANL
ncbi:Dipeptidyl aminopeptidase 4 [Phytophthora citrophthora]|uniref:Dipeptidyl aminopeptidase 4 n=1 Tax=Phytophthora citrophthora TaxID=4793 RepID=A0AAD9G3N3_9STRA|nr:Dipeptidyl aminopeptidase 4 [Phytophthora citrophthora]